MNCNCQRPAADNTVNLQIAATINNKFAQQNNKPALFMRWLMILLLFATAGANAQVSSYSFAASSGTYTALSSPTSVFASGWDDGTPVSIPIGFTFNFNGTDYTSVFVNCNGFISFGATSTAGTPYTPIASSDAYAGAVAAWGRDLQAQPAATLGLIDYKTTGGVFTIQWSNARRYNSSTANTERFDMQIQLVQTTNVIRIVYGTWTNAQTNSSGSANNGQVGLRGATNSDFKSLEVLSAGSWASPTSAGTTNASTVYYNQATVATKPASGQTYTFTPPPTITTSVTSLSTFTQTNGTPSAEQTYTVSGSGLSANVVVTVPSGYEISTTTGTYTPGNTSVTLTQSSGTLTGQPVSVYVRLNAGSNGAYNGNITHTSTGATTKNVAVTGNNITPLTGTKTIDNTLATAGSNYASFTAAINALNLNGVGSGGVTFNVTAGQTFTENTPTITATGTLANQIIFQKNGVAANPIISASGSTGTEAAILINGSDYLTFDGINITASGTALEYGYYLQNASATNGAQNNTIKNFTVTLNRTNGASIGIVQLAATTATSAAGANSTNKFYNFTIKNANAGILLSGTAGFPDLNCEIGTTACATRNTIGDPLTTDDILYSGAAGGSTYGIRVTNTGSVKIFNNDITNVTTSINNSTADGIFVDNGAASVAVGTSEVYNNKISTISNSSTGANTNSVIRGIRVNGNAFAATITRVYNNFITNLQSGNTNATLTIRRIIGISLQPAGSGSGSGIYAEFNSVRIAATNLAVSNACLEIGTGSGPIFRVRNNILANVTGAQTGSAKHYCWISTQTAGVGAAGSLSNYNDLYVTGTNGFVGLGNTTDYATLANWQTGVTQDANSISTDPGFTSATDLHATAPGLNGTADPSYATNTAWATVDIDCATRPATTDIGADEFNVNNDDAGVTAIVLPSPLCPGTQTVQATIKNYGLTTLTSVKVDWTVNGNAQTQASPTVNIASGATQTVTIGTFNFGSPTTYSITATTSLPNGNADGNTGNDAFTQGSITTGLSGSYNVGTGQAFTTLTAAVAAYNAKQICGPVTFLLTDATYTGSETFPITINANTGSSATNTLNIRPNTGITSTISGSVSSDALLKLNGADYVTINGSNSGGTDKSLTITNTSSTSATAISLISLGTAAGATNNTIKNCNISTGSNAATSYGIAVGGSTPGNAGDDNDNTTIQNNSITQSYFGVFVIANSTGKDDNLNISQNTIGSAGASTAYIGKTGISVTQATTATISSNTIFNINGTVTNPIAMTISTGVTSSVINGNTIRTIKYTGTSGYGGKGIDVNTGTASSALTISNNMISDLVGDGWSDLTGDAIVGIRIGATGGSTTTTGGVNVYHNTINLGSGTFAGNSSGTLSAAFYISSTATSIDLRDNIFVTNLVNSGASGAKTYAIYSAAANTAFTNINYNDYYISGAQGVLGFIGSDRTTLAAIVTGFGGNANSVNIAPVFTSATDLHLIPASSASLDNLGTSVGITTDIDGDSRSGSTPDMGADEFTGPSCSGAVGGTASGSTSFCTSGTPTITASGYSVGTGSGYQWYSSTNISDYPNAGSAVSGQTNPASLTTGVVSTTTYYWLRVTCTSGLATDNSTMVTVTIKPVPTASAGSNSPVCTGGTLNLTGTTNIGTSYSWTGPNSFSSTSQSPSITNVTLAATGTYSFTATLNGCTSTVATTSVVVNQTPSAVVITPSSATICVGGIQQLGATGGSVTSNVTLINQNFNGVSNDWTTANASASGTPSAAAWTLRANGYVYSSTTFNSNDLSQFYMSNSDAQGSGGTTSTTLTSPTVSTVNFTSLSLTYYHYFRFNASPDQAVVEVSTNGGGAWTAVQTHTSSQGSATSFVQATVNLNAYVGNATLQVRFRYGAAFGYYWAIDNVVLSGSQTIPGSFVWTPNGAGNGLYSNNTATTIYSGAASPTVYASPTATTTYTATSTVNGCSSANTVAVTIGTSTITATAGTGGSVTPSGANTVNCGTSPVYTITPSDACHSIANVVVDGVSQGAISSYTFTNITQGAHTISATFNLITYSITVTAGANGSITPATGSVNCGANATYTITPNTCYSIQDVVVDGVSQGAIGTYTFTNVTANHTISATFAINTYTATVNAGANGTITPGSATVNCGSNNTYTITPNACYHIVDVTLNGVSQGAVSTLNVNNVSANYTVAATFAINTYTATVNAGANGTITPGSATVNCGSNNTYTITPNACYHIADVTLNGVSQGAVSTLNVNNVSANYTVAATFALNTYTITVTAGANGSITPATGSVNCGDNATYTITPNACYSIADVVVDGVSQGAVGTYTFTNVTANHTISATFVLNTYTITVTAGTHGSITPATGSVNCGSNATYTITADACYAIADVVIDGSSVGAVSSYTFTNVTANHTISATFVETTYTITVTAGANGSITPGTGSVNCGDNATYTITPNACYSIADVVVDGVSQGAVGTYTFTNVTANHTISATFVLNTYTITVTAGANGSITPATGSVNCGDNATYTITPNACYAIADVVVDGVSQGAVGTYTFTNVTANHTISATFVLNTYTITVTAGANGSITPATGSVNCGGNATYTITANACYSIADVVVDGVSQGAVGTYTFTNVTANHTISATFVLNTYTITVTAGANGSITPGTGSVNCGDNATYTITPNACYAIADVVVDGVSQGAVGTYTFTNVTANHTISATFVLNTYTITVTAGANGSITPGTGSVNCGDNATYTITPNACYSIADVLVDGSSVGAVGFYTFSNVTANHTISATFVLTTYTITASGNLGGTITPSGAVPVNCGGTQSFSITPNNACQQIIDITVDGVSGQALTTGIYATGGTYVFTGVTANHTISVTFGPVAYTITASSTGSGTIFPPGAQNVCYGQNQTYTITPDACNSIADVLVDGVSVGAVSSYTFTNVTTNHTISASFSLNTYNITVTAGANGSITPGTGSVNCGDNATYTITPNACYAIADVVVDGVSQGAVGTYTFTNVTANHTISATFVLNTYTITVTAGANGSITPSTGSVNCGDNATYTITPNACYAIADVVVDGVSQGAVSTYTFTNVTANHTISATFALTNYTITVTAGANGSITPATGSVNCGANATYTITPNACYSIADVVVDGVSQGAVGTYTFTNVTANHTISATFVLNTYTITVTAGANGSVTPATGSVNCGDNATYTITPNACYSIADVVVDGVSQGAVGTYTFTNVTANHTISATFVLNTYTITVTAGANGSVTPATGSVNCGANATYTITPNACYSIADVVVDGVSQGAVGTYTFTNVTANHTISATFVLNTYTITVTAGANGSVTPATGSVNCGDNDTYTITPNACYSIADVVVDGVSQGAVGTYTFTNVTANHTISATFVLNTYTITVTAGANGSITPATGSVNCGANATYTITPNACYSIADVVVDGVSQGAVGTYTFTNVTANHTISATFVLNTYTITVTAGANGSITPATGSVNCGDNATYTITPNACYSIADVVVDGVSQGAVGTYTFTNVTANHTISATFVLNTYTITVTAGANGSITPATGSVNCGDNATYTITPNACYSIADVVVDGVSQGAVGSYTFTNVTANHTISATFVLNTYTITVTAGANGSITPATGSVNCGANATYTITPNACYAIADVVVDGVSQGAVGTYTFTNVTANHTISATFVLTNYTITVTAGANGSITPATGSVNCGANATYTITPNACYSIADVVVDGVSQGAVGTYTFTNVTANHTISATFVLNTYTITVTAGANGSITPVTGSVNCGANATYTITPNACYSIADVVVDGVSQGAVGTYTFTNVTANHTISATFVLNTYTITVTAGANGSVTPGTGSVNCGANATYTITPNACYSIADVVVDGVSQGAVGTYTFTNVTANHTISATFVLNTYTITVTAGANGSITPGTGSVNCGANATYTITPNGGYTVANVIVDGSSVGAVTTYTFTNVTANHIISATFVNNASFTITSSAGANGSISPNGVTSVNSGANQSYTITPAACYHVQDVLVDGSSVGAVTSYTFTNVTANHTISATFAINTALSVSVSGPVNVCQYVGTTDQVVYTATAAGATGFTWVVPSTNVTIISGQGTSTLTVTFQNGFSAQNNKQIRVTALSACGNSPQFIYYLTATTPGTPQAIVASSTNICAVIGTAGTITYTIPSVPGATSYTWSAQAGTTTINHPNGPGANDTTVTVSFTAGFSNSNISVFAVNSGCGAGGTRSLLITRSNPSQPGLISGSTNACPYMAPNGIPATYSVALVPNATTYTWTVPAGVIGLTGQGTNTISFTYPNTFVSGTVSVIASNGCGSSSARSLSISKLAPATPSVIDVIQTQPCPDRVYTYTLSGMPANATSVQWTVPIGATLVSGQGTTSITVSYTSSAYNSAVTAQSLNNCGSSTIRSTPVKLPTCAIERTTIAKGGSTVTTAAVDNMLVNVYPNPTVNDFKLQVTTSAKEVINVRILDLQGRQLKAFTTAAYQTINVGADLKAGTYMIEVRQGNNVKVTKLIKF